MSQANATGTRATKEVRRAKGVREVRKVRGAAGARGATGATGARGAIGLMGHTGATGPVMPIMTLNDLSTIIYNFQAVPRLKAIIWSTNTVVNGAAITHTLGSPTISLAPNQIYLINYNLELENNSGITTDMRTELNLNGVSIPGSFGVTSFTRNGRSSPVTNTVLVRTDAGVNDLALINIGPKRFYAVGGAGNMTIIKLR